MDTSTARFTRCRSLVSAGTDPRSPFLRFSPRYLYGSGVSRNGVAAATPLRTSRSRRRPRAAGSGARLRRGSRSTSRDRSPQRVCPCSRSGFAPLQTLDVMGDLCQIVVELMSASIELAGICMRNLFRIEREVCERHPLVVAAVVEEHRQASGERRREVLLQNVLVDLPVLDAPVGWRDQEHPGYGCNCLLLRDVLQQDRCSQRMADEKDLAIELIEFTCYPVSPRRVLRAILLWHLRTPHLVPAAQRVTKTCRHFPVFLVCPFSAAMNEQQLPFHSCVPDWMAFFPSANDRPFATRARRSCASALGPTPCNPSTSAWLTLVS